MRNRHPISQSPVLERTRPWWTHVRSLIEALWAMLGGPEDVLARGVLTRQDYTFFDTMLRGAEALVRRILLIDASEAPPPARSRARSAQTKAPGASEAADPEKPETWRVSFRLAPSRKRKGAEGEGDEYTMRVAALNAQTSSLFADARPLARRFEALLRVFDAPERYVRRLARRIRRDKRILRSFLAIPRLPPWAGAHALEEIKLLVDPAWDRLALNTS